MKQLISIASGWLLLNAILPIVFRSFESLYQKQIGSFASKSLSYLKRFSLKLCQLLLIIIFLPNIAIKTLLEKACPKVFDIASMEYFDLRTNAILVRDFPRTSSERIEGQQKGIASSGLAVTSNRHKWESSQFHHPTACVCI
jgi:hypothetical protein